MPPANLEAGGRTRIQRSMRVWSYAIWFVGAAVWLLVAALSLRFGVRSRTLGALAVAVVFFAAGMFFARNAPPRKRP